MRLVLYVPLALSVAASGWAAPALKEKPNPNPILGAWVRVTIEEGGVPRPVPPRLRWEFLADGRRLVSMGDERPRTTRFTAKPSADPMTIEMSFESGGGVHGVYKVDGDTLTMAVSDLANPRPVNFNTKPGDKVAVYVFSRVKSD